MFPNALIVEQLLFAPIAIPVDLQGATGTHVDGDWINVAHMHRFGFLLYKSIGTAGQDPTITILQATSSAGAGSKALNFTTIYTRESTASEGLKTVAAAGQWTKTTQSSSNTYTTGTSAESELLWWVEFRTDQMDVTNGFDFVNLTIADVGGAAQLGAVLLLGVPREMLPAASMKDVRS